VSLQTIAVRVVFATVLPLPLPNVLELPLMRIERETAKCMFGTKWDGDERFRTQVVAWGELAGQRAARHLLRAVAAEQRGLAPKSHPCGDFATRVSILLFCAASPL
jgi:hypothetical protein